VLKASNVNGNHLSDTEEDLTMLIKDLGTETELTDEPDFDSF